MKKGFLNFLFMASLSFALVFLILLNCSTEVIYEEPQTAPTTTTYAPTTSTSTSTTSTTTYASTTVGPSTTTTVAIVYYKVTYDGNNNTSGSVPTDSTDYEANDLVTMLANSGSLLKTGYIFGGWNTEADGTGTNYAAGTGTFNITGNTTLYAKWNSYSYTVTFDSDGGTPATTTKSVISPATTVGTLPANPAKGGFYFAGWFTEKSGSGTQFMANTIVTGNLTVYANWSSVVKYAVVFDVDGGSAVDTQYVEAGAKVEQPTAPTKTNHTFDGWYKEGTFTNLWNFALDTVTGDTTLYAKWIPDQGNVSVTINLITPATFDVIWDGTGDLVLTQGEILDVTADIAGATAWRWYLDGDVISGQTAKNIKINTTAMHPGLRRLDVIVTKDGMEYSAYIKFEINN